LKENLEVGFLTFAPSLPSSYWFVICLLFSIHVEFTFSLSKISGELVHNRSIYEFHFRKTRCWIFIWVPNTYIRKVGCCTRGKGVEQKEIKNLKSFQHSITTRKMECAIGGNSSSLKFETVLLFPSCHQQ
jgi:hypothetical protein